jgi:hypothetical protein
MYRTADEALYDSVRPAIPYEAPVSWERLENEEQSRAVQEKKLCARCFAPIISFSESFTMDAGQGALFIVTENSGLCRACFDALKATPPKYRTAPRVKINYAFGTEELQTIEDLIE